MCGFIFLNFYCSTVNLQCYVSFRCTIQGISYIHTYSQSFLRFFSHITTNIESPVLYSRSLIVIFYIWTRKSLSRVRFFVIPWTIYSPWNSPGQNIGMGSLSPSRGPSQPRNRTGVSCIAGGFFTNWAIREAYFIHSSVYMSIPTSQFIPPLPYCW